MDADRENEAKVNPAALTPADVVRLLSMLVQVQQKDAILRCHWRG
jgi:hypothetical protein